jgi:hypothetical protein
MGGGMYNLASTAIVTDCTFSGNSASGSYDYRSGAGMYNEDSSPTVTGCMFLGNQAEFDGGGMCNLSSSPTVASCTFSDNTAYRGGGMYNADGSSPIVTNCVLWGDTDGSDVSEIYDWNLSSPVVTYCDVQGGYEGESNIDSDPLFVSTTDLHLQDGSPCVDTGSNDAVPSDVTEDLDGNPRIVDGNGDSTATVDMGAYEVQP